jgi:3-deoxy-7-phosphoheptulonate synthase
MIFVLKPQTKQTVIKEFIQRLARVNLQGVAVEENDRSYVAVVNGSDVHTDFNQFKSLPEVETILPFTHKFKLASRELKKEPTVIRIGNCTIGNGTLAMIAGPCAIESEEHVYRTAGMVKAAGANILRGGAFKPRTSPYDFQGLGEEGLRYMQKAAKAHQLVSVSEVMDTKDIDLVANYVDILQIGARNMQNFSLLKQVGSAGKPILLKRGLSATYMELLMAAEYILQSGNPDVILCERGIRTFETYTRNTLDIAAIPILHELSHLPVIVDPSHGTGIRNMVKPLALAAVAAGADGLIIEVHPEPDNALSDAKQTISPSALAELMAALRVVGEAVNIKMPQVAHGLSN